MHASVAKFIVFLFFFNRRNIRKFGPYFCRWCFWMNWRRFSMWLSQQNSPRSWFHCSSSCPSVSPAHISRLGLTFVLQSLTLIWKKKTLFISIFSLVFQYLGCESGVSIFESLLVLCFIESMISISEEFVGSLFCQE